MATINVESSAVSHGKGNGGGVTYIMGGGTKSSTFNSLHVQSINAANGNIDYLKTKSISANDIGTVYLSAVDGIIQKISGNELKYNQGYIGAFGADTIEANKLKVKDIDALNAWIETLNSKEITTEYLTVTKQAHFFELIIDKIRSVGGQLIITPASCVVDYVYEHTSGGSVDYYDVYWRDQDEATGRNISNDFVADDNGHDQVICQSFNNAHVGVNNNISNKYYWRLVTDILDDAWINLTTGALSTTSQNPSNNLFEVVMYKTISTLNGNDYNNEIQWSCDEQTLQGIQTNVHWTDGTLGENEVVHGIFDSASQLFGIEIKPTTQSDDYPVTTKLALNIKQIVGENSYIIPKKINIGIYFTDDTFRIYNDVHIDSDYDVCEVIIDENEQQHIVKGINLDNADAAIEAIIVVSTADVDWHRCHGIRLSNVSGEYDDKNSASHIDSTDAQNYSSVPAAGDNLVQLGYRGNDDPNRQSAIIISAYKTPDQGGTINDVHYDPVVSPSYAQYMGINDFNLFTHRGTYIDATGGYFKGNLVSSDGTIYDIDKDIINTYKIIPDYNVITIEEGTVTPQYMTVKFLSSTSNELEDTVPTGCIFQYSINGVMAEPKVAGQSVSIDIRNMSAGQSIVMYINEYSNGQAGKLYDTVKMTVAEVTSQPGTTGQNGSYNQWAYQNATGEPDAPTPSDSTYPPSGWTGEPSTPDFANGEYTWETTRTITFNPNNTPNYGNWCTPYRISGDNGMAGEDGKYTEFIYKHTTGPWSPSGADDPENWDANSPTDANGHTFPDPDYIGPSGAGWTDNPQGIGTIGATFYQYEYMSSRRFNGTSFDSFTEPKIWSSFGEKGRDGDGYEYIFKTFAQEQTSWASSSDPNKDENPANWSPNQNDEYYGPSSGGEGVGYNWYDDPQTLDETNNKYEYVSVRKKKYDATQDEVLWGTFSTPELWAMYGGQGPQGPTGPMGPAGPAGGTADQYYLIPLTETYEVRINYDQVTTQAYENITGTLYTELEYGVVHKDGTNVTYLSASDLRGYTLIIIANCTEAGANTYFDASDDHNYYIGEAYLNKDSSSGVTIGTLRFKATNLLEKIWPNNISAEYRDFYELYKTGNADRAPIQLNIALYDINRDYQPDQTCLDLIFKPSHLFSVSDTALNSIYQGLCGSTGPYTQTGFSSLRQKWDDINLSVNNLQYANSGELQQDSYIEQFIYQHTSSNIPPNTPVSGSWDNTPSGWYHGTDYSDASPTEQYKYTWICKRTRAITGFDNNGELIYGNPTSWSDPELFDKFELSRRGTVNTAQLDIKADQITSTVTSQVINTEIPKALMDGKTIEIDLTYDALTAAGLDLSSISGTKASVDSSSNYKAEAVFIPVGISFDTDKGQRGEGWDILIERNFDQNLGYPYYSNHRVGGSTTSSDTDIFNNGDGFDFAVCWHTVGSGYGTTWDVQGTIDNDGFYPNEKNISNTNDTDFGKDTYRYIISNDFNWTQERTYSYRAVNYTIPRNLICGSIRQDSYNSIELIYLRGGSKYRIHTDNFEATAQVYATGYNTTIGERTINMPVIFPDSINNIIRPVADKMKRSEIIQTADEIALNVYDETDEGLKKTGIDIQSGKIELNSDNTNVIGNLNVKGNDSAFQFLDDNGNVKLRLGNSDLSTKDKFLQSNIIGRVYQEVWYDAQYGETDYISIGNWNRGTISISGGNIGSCYLRKNNGHGHESEFNGTGVTVQLTLKLYYYNGSTYTAVGGQITTSTSLNTVGYFNNAIGGGTFNTSSSGQYFIKYEWVVTGLGFDTNDVYYKFYYAFTYSPNIRVPHVSLGNNGFGIAYSASDTDYFYTGSQNTEICYGTDWRRKFAVNLSGVHVGRLQKHAASRLTIEYLGDYYLEYNYSENQSKNTFNFTTPAEFVPGDYFQIFNFTNTTHRFDQAYRPTGMSQFNIIKNIKPLQTHSHPYFNQPYAPEYVLETHANRNVDIEIPPYNKFTGIWDGQKFMCYYTFLN